MGFDGTQIVVCESAAVMIIVGCDGEDDDVRAKGLGGLELLSGFHLVDPIKPPGHFSILGHMQIVRIDYPCVFT